MTAITRKAGREDLGSLLDTELTGVGNPVAEVFDYLTEEPSTFPSMCVASAGSTGRPFTAQGLRPAYRYHIITYVPRDDGAEEAAEDALDDVAAGLFAVIQANKGTRSGSWKSLSYADEFSDIVPYTLGGRPVWMETTPVIMETF